MNAGLGYDRCLMFINCQMQPGETLSPAVRGEAGWQAVTFSRQRGCGASVVAEQLREILQARTTKAARPWTVFDRNLLEQVLADHNLPARLASFMPEDRVSGISDAMEEIFGLHPPSWILVRQTAETVLRLAELGNVILIGRGANVITATRKHVFHVRLVGSLEQRAGRVQAASGLGREAAMELIQREDRGRARYLKQYFQKKIDDPLLYHLTINTDSIPGEVVARTIARAMMRD